MTVLVDKLENEGLLERKRFSDLKLCYLTPKGRLLARVLERLLNSMNT